MKPFDLGVIGQDGPEQRTCRRQSTSTEAYERAKTKSDENRRLILELLKAKPSTDDEMQEVLGMNPSTQRPRRCELRDWGQVVKTTQKRLTRSGSPAFVWAAAPVMEGVA